MKPCPDLLSAEGHGHSLLSGQQIGNVRTDNIDAVMAWVDDSQGLFPAARKNPLTLIKNLQPTNAICNS